VPTIPDVTFRRSSSARGVSLGEIAVSGEQVMSIDEAGAGRLSDGASRTGLCVRAGKSSQCRRLERFRLGDDSGLVRFEGPRLPVAQSRQWYVGIDRRPDPFFRRDELRGCTIILPGRAPIIVRRGPTLLGFVDGVRSRESGGLEGERSGDDQLSGSDKHDGEVVMRKSLMKSSRR
jgi:hypothetical protein